MGATRSPTTIRIFVASPGDVAPERDILDRVVRALDQSLEAWRRTHRLELRRWEVHAHPAAGRPQHVINQQIGPYDIFVGLMWRRFGTPSGEAGSGTAEEYERAYTSWRESGKPHIMFYFSMAPAPPPRTVAEAEQLLAVAAFRERIEEENLIGEYDGAADFEGKVRPHLISVITQFLPEPPRQRSRRRRKPDPIAREVHHAVRKKQVQRSQQEHLIEDAMRKIRTAVKVQPPRSKGKNSKPPAKRLKKDEVALVVKLVTRVLNETQWG
ncbi:MAG: hypothetical protein QOJ98_17 [Acidobacteriota bacterium]|jgi:hypothetical protein|nr:hypothetical protein [Acidobacteriota bacterium]